MSRYARIIAVVVVQLGILVAVPARQVRARISGAPITLRTAPVDPFDVLSGHFVTLSYEVERSSSFVAEPGLTDGAEVWLTVTHAEPAWKLVSVTRRRPAPTSGLVAIRARWRSSWQGPGSARIEGAQRFFVTGEEGARVDATTRGERSALVDLRVGEDGTPAIVALRMHGMVVRDE